MAKDKPWHLSAGEWLTLLSALREAAADRALEEPGDLVVVRRARRRGPGSGDDPEAVEPAVTENREDLFGGGVDGTRNSSHSRILADGGQQTGEPG